MSEPKTVSVEVWSEHNGTKWDWRIRFDDGSTAESYKDHPSGSAALKDAERFCERYLREDSGPIELVGFRELHELTGSEARREHEAERLESGVGAADHGHRGG